MWSSLPTWWFDPEGNLTSDQPVVSVAVCTGHNSCVKYICDITLTYQDIIQEVPMLGAWGLPGGFESGFLLEHVVGYVERVLHTELQSQVAIVVAVSNSVLAKNTLPEFIIAPNLSIEVTQYEKLVLGVSLQ